MPTRWNVQDSATNPGIFPSNLPTHWVGRYDGGPPPSGQHQVGDWTTDATTPDIWICTVAGAPGTFVSVSSAGTVASVTNADGTITITGSGSNPVVSRAGITGDVSIPAGSDVSTALAIHGTTVPATPSTNQAIVATGGTTATWQAIANSVFGRSGAVTAQSGDYTAAQVTNAADKSSGSNQDFTAEVGAPDIEATGLTGAANPVRMVGSTTTGAPVSGTFELSDFVVAQNGHIFVCTASGSPGTWVDVGSVGNLVTSVFTRAGAVVATTGDYTAAQVTNAADKASGSNQDFTSEVSAPDLEANGLTGAANATRLVGGNASGSPASGTFEVRDHVINTDGSIWVCTVAGSPGTWVNAGSVGNLVTSVTADDASIVVNSGTGTVNIETGTLDAIATAQPPAADWSNNSHKITSLTQGTVNNDAVAFPVPVASIASIAANTVIANSTGGTAVPTATATTGTGVPVAQTAAVIQPKEVDGVAYVDLGNPQGWFGADAGAWINSAYSYLVTKYGTAFAGPPIGNTGSGIIQVGPGVFTFTTPIVLCDQWFAIKLRGNGDGMALTPAGSAGKGGTVLNYTPTSGIALTMGGASSNNGGVQVEDLTVFGGTVGVVGVVPGGTAIGIQWGYSPITYTVTPSTSPGGNWTITATGTGPTITATTLAALLGNPIYGTNVAQGTFVATVTFVGATTSTFTTNLAASSAASITVTFGGSSTAGGTAKNVAVAQFATGELWNASGSIAYAVTHINCKVQYCATGAFPFGEANAWDGGLFGNNTTAVAMSNGGTECAFLGTAFDDNTTTAINISNASARAHLLGARFENAGGGTDTYITQSNGSIDMTGGALQTDPVSGTSTGFVQMTGGIASYSGVWLFSAGRTVTQVFNTSNTAASISLSNIRISPATSSPATTLAVLLPAQYLGTITANTAALTAADTLIKSIPIPANTMLTGSTWRIRFHGQYNGTVSNAASFRARCGINNSIADGLLCTITTAAAGTAPVGFSGEILVTVRSLGTAALMANGFAILAGTPVSNQTATVSVVSTLNNFLSLTAGVAATTSNLTFTNCTIEPVQLNSVD